MRKRSGKEDEGLTGWEGKGGDLKEIDPQTPSPPAPMHCTIAASPTTASAVELLQVRPITARNETFFYSA